MDGIGIIKSLIVYVQEMQLASLGDRLSDHLMLSGVMSFWMSVPISFSLPVTIAQAVNSEQVYIVLFIILL